MGVCRIRTSDFHRVRMAEMDPNPCTFRACVFQQCHDLTCFARILDRIWNNRLPVVIQSDRDTIELAVQA